MNDNILPPPQGGAPNERFMTDFYAYNPAPISVGAGASATATLSIQADSNFSLQKLTYFATAGGSSQTASTRVIPSATITITDTGSGRQLSDLAGAIPALFGTGELPFILPKPKLFAANSSFSLVVNNVDASADYVIYLSFIGYKVFFGGA